MFPGKDDVKKKNDRAILKFDPQCHTLDAFFFKSPIFENFVENGAFALLEQMLHFS